MIQKGVLPVLSGWATFSKLECPTGFYEGVIQFIKDADGGVF
jgi:hypothetical protein